MKIKLKGVMEENLQDYRKAGIFLAFPSCDWKCLKEQNLDISICQNSHLAQEPIEEYDLEDIWELYEKNPLTDSWIIGGLEPFANIESDKSLLLLTWFIRTIKKCNDDIIIFTGFYPEEISQHIEQLKKYKNIIIKFGRFIKNSQPKYDEVLGITLVSENQYAEKIS